MAIPTLSGSYIDETYQRLVQVSGAEFADGLGNPITFGTTPTGSLLVTASAAGNIITFTKGDGSTFPISVSGAGSTYNTATGSYGSFYDTGSVIATSATAIYSMSLSTTDISNGVSISGSTNPYNTFIKVANAGVYNLQFSAQFSNSDNTLQDVIIWVRKNGTNIEDSSGVVGVPPFKAGSNGQVIAGWNYFLDLSANDYVQLCWHVEQDNVITLETIAAGTNPTHPRTPSLILTAQRVDTFLSNTGSFSGSFNGAHTGSFSGSVFGYVANAQTGSFVLNSYTASVNNSITNLNTFTSSVITAYVANTQTGSFIRSAQTESFAITGSNAFIGNQTISGSVTATNFTGSLFGTASWATNALTSSYPIAVSGTSLYTTFPAAGPGFNTSNGIFIGSGSGFQATSANLSVFIGYQAGYQANLVSNHIGYRAGYQASSATYLNTMGASAGFQATNAAFSNFFGGSAGANAANATYSNFIGNTAGGSATDASYSNFVGYQTGRLAASASYSTLIGYQAGYNPAGLFGGTGISSNNIIIGTNITLPDGTKDSINLGGIIFATGSYATIAGAPHSGSTNGRVGIGTTNPVSKLHVSGTTTITGEWNANTTRGLHFSFRDNNYGAIYAIESGVSWRPLAIDSSEINLNGNSGGIIKMPYLTNATQTNVVSVDTATGQLYYQVAGVGAASVDDINTGTGTNTVTPENQEQSKYSTHNIFNYLNFT